MSLDTSKPRSRQQIRRDAKLLARAVVAASAAELLNRAQLYRHIVKTKSLAYRRHWIAEPDNRRVLGDEWFARETAKLNAIEKDIQEAVPSGAWFDAIWRRGETFPPQDKFDRPAAEKILEGWKKSGRISGRLHDRCLKLLDAGIDPVQIISRWAARSRMRHAQQRVRYGAPAYVDGRPLTGQYTRRPTPPQSIGHSDGSDDKYDAMSPIKALFCPDPPSVTALQFRKIEMLRGRDERDGKKKTRAKKRAERERVRAAKRAAGVEDEDEDDVETIDDEEIDVDCTDVR